MRCHAYAAPSCVICNRAPTSLRWLLPHGGLINRHNVQWFLIMMISKEFLTFQPWVKSMSVFCYVQKKKRRSCRQFKSWSTALKKYSFIHLDAISKKKDARSAAAIPKESKMLLESRNFTGEEKKKKNKKGNIFMATMFLWQKTSKYRQSLGFQS